MRSLLEDLASAIEAPAQLALQRLEGVPNPLQEHARKASEGIAAATATSQKRAESAVHLACSARCISDGWAADQLWVSGRPMACSTREQGSTHGPRRAKRSMRIGWSIARLAACLSRARVTH